MSFRSNYLMLITVMCGLPCSVIAQIVCVHMKDCPAVYDLLRSENGQEVIEKLICEEDFRYPKIWCRISCVTNDQEAGYCSLERDCSTITKNNTSVSNNLCDITSSSEQFVCCSTSFNIDRSSTHTPEMITETTTKATTETTLKTTTETSPKTTTETTTKTTTEMTTKTTTETTTKITTESVDVETTSETNIKLRNGQPDSEICGIQSDVNKVANGKIASMNDHPWSALLQYSEKNKLVYKCGGTLISNKYVLTAAHCVHMTRFKLLNIILGEYNVSSEVDCFHGYCMPKPLRVGIKNIIVHPSWLQAERPFYNDIALIELQHEVEYNDFIRPICLPSSSAKLSGQLTVAGWGKTEFGKLSDVKRLANLDIQPRSACLNTVRIPLKLSQLCVGGAKADSCDGDSGGPLMDVDYSGFQPTWSLVGIVSLGSGKCGSIGKPAIYTNVSYYNEWILDKIV